MAWPESPTPWNATAFPITRSLTTTATASGSPWSVRWFLIATGLFLHNYRPDVDVTFVINNALAISLGLLNGYVHWRILKGRPVTRRYVLALSLMDLSAITAGIGVSSRFDNTFFILYYPALLGLALVFSSRRLTFTHR